jgi:hypothetical protein
MPRSVHVQFVVDEVAPRQIIILHVLWFSPVVSFQCSPIVTLISSMGWANGPLRVQFHTDSLNQEHDDDNP